MNNEENTEVSKNISQGNILEYMKDSYGIEFFNNEFLPTELESLGYRKMSLAEVQYIEPLFQLAPQLIVDKINSDAVKNAFKAATENSYKCLLDPSMHLATTKGTTDVFIGTGLDNATNKVKGQARWIKQDTMLSVSNAPQIALNAFNALSVVTGQYFMAQVNANLLEIKDGINEIKQYFEADRQSKLETVLQELYEIIDHISFITNDPKRVHTTLIQIDDIRKVAKTDINFYKKQIENIINITSYSDKETVIKNNIETLRKYMVQYRYAVNVYNLAHSVKIYFNNITDIEELSLYRNEISDIVNQYIIVFDKTNKWAEDYLDKAKILNNESKTQKALAWGSGIVVGKRGNYILANQSVTLVNNLFNNRRKKKKEAYILSDKKYQNQMNDMDYVNSSISAMDRYIDMVCKKAEVVTIDGEFYLKYIEE